MFNLKLESDLLNDLLFNGKGWILFFISTGWFFSIGIRFSYPTLLPFFQNSFNISLTIASLLISVMWIAYAIGQFPGGVFADRFGEGNILVTSCLLSLIGIFVLAITKNVLLLFVGTILFGFATALFGPTRFTILTDIYSDKSGIAVGITMAAGSIGNALIPLVATVFASYLSWQLGFGVLIPIFVGISYGIWYYVPNRTSKPLGKKFISRNSIILIYNSIKNKKIPVFVSIHVLSAFVSQGFLALYPTYLVVIKGLSPSIAAFLYGLYFTIGIIVQPLTGQLRDKYGFQISMSVILWLYFICLFFLPHIHGFVGLAILTMGLSVRNGLGVLTNTYISLSLPNEIKGSGLGLLRTIWIFIGALSPAIIGFFADVGYFTESFMMLTFIMFLAAILTIFIPKTAI